MKSACVHAIFKIGRAPLNFQATVFPSSLLGSYFCHFIDTHLSSCGVQNPKHWDFRKGLPTKGMLNFKIEKWRIAIDSGSDRTLAFGR